MQRRPVGLTADAGWQVGVSRSVAAAPEDVWAVLVSDAGVAAWLGAGVEGDALRKGAAYEAADGTRGEVRSRREDDRIRLTWQPPERREPAILQLTVSPSPKGTTLRVHADHLADAEDRERTRAHGRGILDRLLALL